MAMTASSYTVVVQAVARHRLATGSPRSAGCGAGPGGRSADPPPADPSQGRGAGGGPDLHGTITDPAIDPPDREILSVAPFLPGSPAEPAVFLVAAALLKPRSGGALGLWFRRGEDDGLVRATVCRLRRAWARVAVRAGLAAAWVSRRSGLGAGSIIGGRVALALDPDALSRLAAGRCVVLVSGTNGKTTTSHLLAAVLRTAGRVAHNATGSNMADGAVAALAAAADAEYAVLEVDEWHLAAVAEAVDPVVVLLLNLTRDQLDRGTEVRAVAAALGAALVRLPRTLVVGQCRRSDGGVGGGHGLARALGGRRRGLDGGRGNLSTMRQHPAHRRSVLEMRLRAGQAGAGLVARWRAAAHRAVGDGAGHAATRTVQHP